MTTYSRIREQGTKEFKTTSDDDKLTACRIILHDKTYAKVDGVMVDTFTASAIIQVYEGLNDKNKSKFLSAPISKMGLTAHLLLAKVQKD